MNKIKRVFPCLYGTIGLLTYLLTFGGMQPQRSLRCVPPQCIVLYSSGESLASAQALGMLVPAAEGPCPAV